MHHYKRAYYRTTQENISSAREVLSILLSLLKPQSVVDVGCGSGAWLAAFIERGVNDVTGYDGAWVRSEELLIPESHFRRVDLEKSFSPERTYDLAISLEVAEHLPRECAATLVETLTRLSTAVLFSAAIPYQGGTNHINEQWPGYWIKLFKERGYSTVDCLRMQLWENSRVRWWYAQNILLFTTQSCLASNAELLEAYRNNNLQGIPLVHPRRWEKQCDPSKMPLKNAMVHCARIFANSIARYTGKSPAAARAR
jgi:SAM-dependent methyltransferase